MIIYKQGDILNEDVEALVNTVNCVGVMGRGLALQFKNKYPQNFKLYADACKKNKVKPGRMFVTKIEQLINPKYIINFPTKRHWREKSKMEDIEDGLKDLVNVIQEYGIKSIAIPPLGSGLGGLEWLQVKQKIELAMQELKGIKIVIYEPLDNVAIQKTIVKNIPKMTPGRAAMIELINRYLNGMLDPVITLLEVHKLLYFMQEAGEPLRLKFEKAPYGPYANNLRHVLNKIEGHFIEGYEDGGDNPNKEISLVSNAVNEANKFLESQVKTKENFKKVSDLVNGFETPFGLELLSTVHWVAKEMQSIDLDEIIKGVYSWNERKKQFTKKQIKIALDRLIECSFLSFGGKS